MMDRQGGRTDDRSLKLALILIVAVSALLFITNLGGRDFWAPDEGDFAEIVRELGSDPIVPHLNNTAYGEKPPLFYYAVYASSKAFGWLRPETSMRLASSFAAMAALIALFMAVRPRFGRDRAILSAAILGSAPLFYWQARYLQVDMVFSSALVIALLCFFSFMETDRKRWYYAFFFCLALAFMTKGPLAIALAAPVAVFYCLSERRLKAILTGHTVIGIVLFLAIVVPWYLAVYMREGFPYLYENILRQNFLRFFDAWSHKRPIYYYLTTLPLDFFPWSLFLPLGIWSAVKAWKTDREMRYFFIWFVWFFFFLSLSSGKISKYMLPALPALAVITSATAIDLGRLWNKIVYYVSAGVFCALGSALVAYRLSLYPEFIPERIILAIFAIACGLAILTFLGFRRPRAAFAAIVVFLCLAYMMGNISIFEKWNRYKSPRPIAEKIRSVTAGGTPWVYYGSMRGVYVYYTGSFAVHVDEHDTDGLRRYAAKEKEFYILTRRRDGGEVTKTVPGAEVHTLERIGDTDMVLFYYRK